MSARLQQHGVRRRGLRGRRRLSAAVLAAGLAVLAGCATLNVKEAVTRHPNGMMASRYYYYMDNDGKRIPHGPSETWYENGVLATRREYRDGRLNGIAKVYFRNRELHQYSFRNNAPHGPSVAYHPNGKKKWECRYKDGVLDGEFAHYDEDGKLIVRGLYRRGRPYDGTFLVGQRILHLRQGELIGHELAASAVGALPEPEPFVYAPLP
jgi:hypothetical protein